MMRMTILHKKCLDFKINLNNPDECLILSAFQVDFFPFRDLKLNEILEKFQTI